MEKFITRCGDHFEWKQPKAVNRSFELTRAGQPFGAMEFRSFWGTLARTSDPIQPWSFKRVGFLNPHITIRMLASDSDYALFIPTMFSGGTLRPPDGRLVSWQPLNFWRTHWHFSNMRSLPLLTFRQHYHPEGKVELSEVFKIQAEVRVESNHITNLEFSMLVNLGFYLLLTQAMDAVAMAAASA